MERARLRTDKTRAKKSWTQPSRTAPSTTQITAGTQPQITASAGPTMGAAPAMEAKWWPNSTYLLVGR